MLLLDMVSQYSKKSLLIKNIMAQFEFQTNVMDFIEKSITNNNLTAAFTCRMSGKTIMAKNLVEKLNTSGKSAIYLTGRNAFENMRGRLGYIIIDDAETVIVNDEQWDLIKTYSNFMSFIFFGTITNTDSFLMKKLLGAGVDKTDTSIHLLSTNI
jgi:hypothetical protein